MKNRIKKDTNTYFLKKKINKNKYPGFKRDFPYSGEYKLNEDGLSVRALATFDPDWSIV